MEGIVSIREGSPASQRVCETFIEGGSIRGKYQDYTPGYRASIGKYALENGPANTVRHFSQRMGPSVPESTVRR